MRQIAIDGEHTLTSYSIQSLTDEEYAKCKATIQELYLWFAPDSTDEDIYKRLHRHRTTCLDILVDFISGRCIGFSVHHTEVFEERRVMFRGGTVVADRSKGFYKKIVRHSLNEERPDFLAAMTQNPRVYEVLRSFSPCSRAYPSVVEEPPELIQRIARYFCNAPGLDPVSMHVLGPYQSIRKDQEFRTARDFSVANMFSQLHENDGIFVVVPLGT